MIEAAEILGAKFDFVRADFYEVDGQPLFGELTFYPGSGLEQVQPPALDEAMGYWWSEARSRERPREDVRTDARLAAYA